jgi:hypothetical protein
MHYAIWQGIVRPSTLWWLSVAFLLAHHVHHD